MCHNVYMGIKNYVKKGIEGMWEHGGWRNTSYGSNTELVPIDYFDEMPSFNEPYRRAGDVNNLSVNMALYANTEEDIADVRRSHKVFSEIQEELKQDMSERGLDEPIMITYDHDASEGHAHEESMKAHENYGVTHATGRVLLGEGNHRLAAARDLGWEAIPARVVRGRVAAERFNQEAKIEAMGGFDARGIPSRAAREEHGKYTKSVGEKKQPAKYIGSEASPSDIDIPIMPHGPHSPEGPVSPDQFTVFPKKVRRSN